MSQVLCIDIGNTTTHWGLAANGIIGLLGEMPTSSLRERLGELLERVQPAGIALASVVPAATSTVLPALAALGKPLHHLRHDTVVGIGFDYPYPEEVGQDRIANCIGAQVVCGAPAIVVDLGTATTFDVLTSKGYAGGVIAPGLSVMTSYLHGRTALLPLLDPASIQAGSAIGKSTLDAMRAGCAIGFAGMIGHILDALLTELAAQGVHNPTLLATGGTADFLPTELSRRLRREPNLTLIGLAESWRRQ
jgi:type III pantothenate kinase